MRNIIHVILILLIFSVTGLAGDFIQYISPKTGASHVSIKSTLIVRFHDKWKEYLEKATPPFDDYRHIGYTFIESILNHYEYNFEMLQASDFQAQLVFNCGQEDTDIFLDNISLIEDLSAAIGSTKKQDPEAFN